MKIVVFDTETTSLQKPFCYNIGYVIYDAEIQEVLLQKDFVVEQIWHNLPLFTTAYYADKRQLYISAMRAKKARLEKFGYITQEMIRDFKQYEVKQAYAYNSPFDDNVMTYNCDWFKCINPFDNIPIYDIRGYVHQSIAQEQRYKDFCDEIKSYTESGNYSSTAETAYKYITKNRDYVEQHTALADSLDELQILEYCIATYGMNYGYNYPILRSIERPTAKELKVKDTQGETHLYTYSRRINRDNGNYIILK